MAFVVPGVCQYTIHGTYGNTPVANVLAYRIITTGTITDRNTAIDNMGGILINQWTTDVLPLLNSLYKADHLTWVDLNAADGNIGARNVSGTHTWPLAGGALNASMPGNVAMLVRKNVSAKRGARKGRMFLAGVDETSTQNPNQNNMYTANVSALQTAMDHFLSNTNQSDPIVGTGYQSFMQVIHILTRDTPKKPGRLGPPLTGEGLQVSSLSVDSLLASQRRRLRK